MSTCRDDRRRRRRLPFFSIAVAIASAAIVFALLTSGCRPAAMPLPAGHPARADAPIGRLAGKPAAFDTAPAPAPATDEPPPTDHSGHH